MACAVLKDDNNKLFPQNVTKGQPQDEHTLH